MAHVPFSRFLSVRLILISVLAGAAVGSGALFGIVIPLLIERATASFEAHALVTLSHLESRLLPAAKVLEIAGLRQTIPQAPERWREFATSVSQVAATMPLITSVVAGNERGLGWMYLELPGKGRLVRITNLQQWGNRHRFLELDEHLDPVREYVEALDYDPRLRPWYRLAAENLGKVVWTLPYAFFTTHDVGITGAIGWRDKEGVFTALGFDIRLVELQELLRSLASQHALRLVVTDTHDHIIGDSASMQVPLAAAGGLRILERQEAPWKPFAQDDSTHPTFFWQGVTGWFGARKPIPFANQEWHLWIVAPLSSLMPEWPIWLMLWAAFLIGGTAVAAFLGYLWARQISHPVEELAKAADEIGHARFRTTVPRRQPVSELHRLAFALDSMRRRLAVNYGRLDKQRHLLEAQLEALHAAELRMVYAGLHDSLTDLANRRLLLETARQMMARASRSGERIAMMFIDLDHFKELNDSKGHEWGDKLLIETAKRLRERVRASDLVARLGGDEFILLLDMADYDAAKIVAAEVLQTLAQPYDLGEFQWSVTASIGIALFPEDAADPSSLLRAADVAMYWAKAQGRNRYAIYSPDRDNDQRELQTLREDLRQALERNELELWLQPQIELDSGRLVSVEALARWHHPQRGMISPDIFIPLAEGSGLIDALGRWVLRQALNSWLRLAEMGTNIGRIAINVSAVQLQREDFAQAVLAMLRETGVPARALEIEITESVMADIALAKSRLSSLEAAGVRLAIDDFGTGYSSLAYLSSLPFDVLKIDASFVRDIGASDTADSVIVGLVQIGHSLGMEMVAEGIETAAQRDFLQGLKVQNGQGFLFAKPMPLDSLLKSIEGGTVQQNQHDGFSSGYDAGR